MKKILSILLILFLIFYLYAEDIKDREIIKKILTPELPVYKYLGNKISDKKFDKLYQYFKNYLYGYKGTVYDLRFGLSDSTKNPNSLKDLPSIPQIGDIGITSGKILQVLNDDAILLTNKQWDILKIKEIDTRNLVDGQPVTFCGIRTGSYEYIAVTGASKKIAEITALNLSDDEFREYLNNGNKLYIFKKSHSEYETCSRCLGNGRINYKVKINEGTLMQRYILKTKNCPKCNGKKQILKTAEKWIKVEIE